MAKEIKIVTPFQNKIRRPVVWDFVKRETKIKVTVATVAETKLAA